MCVCVTTISRAYNLGKVGYWANFFLPFQNVNCNFKYLENNIIISLTARNFLNLVTKRKPVKKLHIVIHFCFFIYFTVSQCSNPTGPTHTRVFDKLSKLFEKRYGFQLKTSN